MGKWGGQKRGPYLTHTQKWNQRSITKLNIKVKINILLKVNIGEYIHDLGEDEDFLARRQKALILKEKNTWSYRFRQNEKCLLIEKYHSGNEKAS